MGAEEHCAETCALGMAMLSKNHAAIGMLLLP
jgi:hypothetical protein